MVERGNLRLPELQRGYIWPVTRVRDLLDSPYRSYPSGTILACDTEGDTPEREMAVHQGTRPSFGNHLLLLDGQQRLTSLAAVTRGRRLRLKNRVRPKLRSISTIQKAPDGRDEVEDDGLRPLDEIEAEEPDLNGEGTAGVQEYINNSTFVLAAKGRKRSTRASTAPLCRGGG